MNLYNKYKPNNLKEFIGQKSAIKIIKNIIIKPVITQPNNYIFYGPKGTGKTSLAKIYFKLINCENYKNKFKCTNCNKCNIYKNPDYIEFDAASNRSIKDISFIFKNSNVFAVYSKYKMINIDEAQMLSEKAMKYLLNFLEKPRDNNLIIIFITTEINKLPDTIISRCTSINLKNHTIKNTIKLLINICKKEHILITKTAIKYIAECSKGSLRDALNLLEKCKLYTKKINTKSINKITNNNYKLAFLLIINILYTKKTLLKKFCVYIYKYNINIIKLFKNIIEITNIILYKPLNKFEIRKICYCNKNKNYIKILKTKKLNINKIRNFIFKFFKYKKNLNYYTLYYNILEFKKKYTQ